MIVEQIRGTGDGGGSQEWNALASSLLEEEPLANEKKAGIKQATDAFASLLKESSEVARLWAERLDEFSEKPVGVKLVEGEDGQKRMEVSLTAIGRDLSLFISEARMVTVHYDDGNLEVTGQSKSPFEHLNLARSETTSPDLLFHLEDGGSFRISKNYGSVFFESYPSSFPGMSKVK